MSLVRKAPREAIVVSAVAFGRPDGSLWAMALDAGVPTLLGGGASGPFSTAVAWDVAGADWTLRADGVSLTVTPAQAPESAALEGVPEPSWSGSQELCRVTGTIEPVGSAPLSLNCVGVRTQLDGIRDRQLGSLRAFTGWLGDDEAVALLALRAVDESDQEGDLVAASLFDPEEWTVSTDPRLSTTYAGSGQPTRATLELWFADGEQERVRRVAGEADGPVVRTGGDEAAIEALPLRVHSRGNDGAGVYLLASR